MWLSVTCLFVEKHFADCICLADGRTMILPCDFGYMSFCWKPFGWLHLLCWWYNNDIAKWLLVTSLFVKNHLDDCICLANGTTTKLLSDYWLQVFLPKNHLDDCICIYIGIDLWLSFTHLLVEKHCADLHLANLYFANLQLANFHLANINLTEIHLSDIYLAIIHFAYRHVANGHYAYNIFLTNIWLTLICVYLVIQANVILKRFIRSVS
jgi:hypothetical protein